MLLLAHPVGLGAQLEERRPSVEIEKIAHGRHAAGRKERDPFGT